jgi:uncharacterized protein (DUF1697 family)
VKRWAALLRGVNVGGRQLPMAELRAMLEGLGHTEVRTLLASGNAVFASEQTDAAALEAMLDDAGERAFGFRTPYLVRDRAQIDALVAANPFPEVAAERPSQLVAHFWRGAPPADLPVRVSDIYSGPERLAVVSGELLIDYPEGQGRSELPKAIAKLKLRDVFTARNWNTVLKLQEALAG